MIEGRCSPLGQEALKPVKRTKAVKSDIKETV